MHSGAVDRAAAIKRSQLQLENEANVTDCPAEEAVVNCVTVPVTVAVVPDAEFEKLKEADPAPPLTSPSSVSVSSIMISIRSLHITHLRMRGAIAPASQSKC
jgi:hypothetical protein